MKILISVENGQEFVVDMDTTNPGFWIAHAFLKMTHVRSLEETGVGPVKEVYAAHEYVPGTVEGYCVCGYNEKRSMHVGD